CLRTFRNRHENPPVARSASVKFRRPEILLSRHRSDVKGQPPNPGLPSRFRAQKWTWKSIVPLILAEKGCAFEEEALSRLPLVDVRNKQLDVLFQQQAVPHQLLRRFRDRRRAIAAVWIAFRHRQPRIVVLEPLLTGRREWNHGTVV